MPHFSNLFMSSSIVDFINKNSVWQLFMVAKHSTVLLYIDSRRRNTQPCGVHSLLNGGNGRTRKKYLAFQVNIQTTLADTGISHVCECFIINFEHCLKPGIYPMCMVDRQRSDLRENCEDHGLKECQDHKGQSQIIKFQRYSEPLTSKYPQKSSLSSMIFICKGSSQQQDQKTLITS